MIPIEHFCCQNSYCPDAGTRGGENLYFRGWSGKGRRIRLVYCRTCKRSFSERKGSVLEHARLPDDKVLAILKHIQEGCGTRATGRLVDVNKNTATRYLALAEAHAEKLRDELVALSPRTREVQVDEKWGYNRYCRCDRHFRKSPGISVITRISEWHGKALLLEAMTSRIEEGIFGKFCRSRVPCPDKKQTKTFVELTYHDPYGTRQDGRRSLRGYPINRTNGSKELRQIACFHRSS